MLFKVLRIRIQIGIGIQHFCGSGNILQIRIWIHIGTYCMYSKNRKSESLKGVRLKTKTHHSETQLTNNFFWCHYFLAVFNKVFFKENDFLKICLTFFSKLKKNSRIRIKIGPKFIQIQYIWINNPGFSEQYLLFKKNINSDYLYVVTPCQSECRSRVQ